MRKELGLVVGVLALIYLVQIAMDQGTTLELFLILSLGCVSFMILLLVRNKPSEFDCKKMSFIEILWASFLFGFLGLPTAFSFFLITGFFW